MTSSQILPPTVKSETASLDELERRIRDAQADIERIGLDMVPGLSTMVEKAIAIGKDLIEAEERKMVPYRQRREHYERCNIGYRTASRYKKLARSVMVESWTRMSNILKLTGLSINEAIRELSKKPGRRQQAKLPVQIQQPGSADAPKEPEKKTKKHHDMIAVWMGMPLSERTRAIDGIGWEKLLEAIPENWHPLITKRFTQPEVQAPPLAGTPLIDRGLDIPTFLQRTLVANGSRQ